MLNSKLQGYLSALFATMFMGSLGVFVKNITVNSTIITFFRLSVSALLIFVLVLFKKKLDELKICPSKSMLISGVALSASVIFYVTAIQRTSMSNAVFLLYLGPVFASLSAFVFLKESLKSMDIVSLAISVLGLLFMFRFNLHFKGVDIYGTICGILAGFSYGVIIVANRTIKSNVSLNARSFYQFLSGTLFVIPFAVLHYNSEQIASNFALLIAMSVVCGFLGITLMFNAIKKLPAVEYGVLSYLEMFFAVMFGVLFFKENLDIFKVIGGLLILCSGMLQIFKNYIQKASV